MTRQIKVGTTDVSVVIRIVDSGDGTPETGVTSATGGLDLEYRREGALSTDLTESDLSALTDAHSDGGMLHIGNGYYRLDLPDAACASGATGVLVHGTATGMVVIGEYIELVAYDPYDTVRLGLTALPNATPDTNGGLATEDASGHLAVDVREWLGTAVTTSSTTSKPQVDVDSIDDDATAADNLEAYFDNTGFNASNSTIGTCTTNTDMRGTDSALLAASAPANFSDLAITATTGRVDVGLFGGSAGTFNSGIPDVRLSNSVTHGGSSAVLSLSNVVINASGVGVSITSVGTGVSVTSTGANGVSLRSTEASSSGLSIGGGLSAADFICVLESANFASSFLTSDKIATDAIGSDELAATAVSEIQSGLATSSDVSTAESNIRGADSDTLKTLSDEIAALNNLSQADIRTAVGLAAANLDTQLADLPTVAEFEARTLLASAYFDPAVDTVTVGTNNDKTGYALSAAGVTAVQSGLSTLNAAAVNAEFLDVIATDTLVDGKTIQQALRYVAAVCAGKISGAGTGTETFTGLDGTTSRVQGTVDISGNRTAVTYDP